MPYARRALEMLQQQTFTDFTTFAVDSGSTDGTFQTLEEYCDNVVEIRPEEYIPGQVLNHAIDRTIQDIIVLLNADAIPQTKDWLNNLVLPIIGNHADATFSKQVARPDAKFIVAYDYERAYNPAKATPDFFSAVACAFKRELWEKHTFPENGYAEDTAWALECISSGARFQLLAHSIVEHSHNYSLQALYQKRYRQAVTSNEVPNSGKQIWHGLREIGRDFLHALARFKLHTVPYNIAYRTTIHRAIH
ncbi:MAG: glycosyltransferase, partial [Kiritimatiellaceae bacterium]|nr:glycosyltransferase [Kiritimatiellaceae bacterium]